MLRKKMFRDIKKNLSQFITIFLMIAMGLMAYSGIRSYMDGMSQTANSFYEECNLQDLNITGEITDKDLKKIKNMDHVVDAERALTITADVTNYEGSSIEVNFIEDNDISSFYVVDGSKFDKNKDGVWLDSYFCEKNDIQIGDSISLKYDGYTFKEKVVGIVMTPDHIYSVKDDSTIFPDHSTWGYSYISMKYFPADYIKQKAMDEIDFDEIKPMFTLLHPDKEDASDEEIFDELNPDFDYKDYISYSSCIVDVDKKSNVKDVKTNIEDNVKDAVAVTKSEDSRAYTCVTDEIEEGESYTGIFSGIFLFIALLSVITTMTRLVKKQRIEIGTLKAIGFKDRRIVRHYVGYGFWISLAGAILGLILGPLVIGKVFVNLEFTVFEGPNPVAGGDSSCYLIGAIIVLAVCVITWLTCRNQLKENPADTLRAKMPNVRSGSLNITNKGFFKKLGFTSIWNVRDILRNKMRTAMGIAGICGCCVLIVAGLGMYDSFQSYFKWEFDTLCNFKYKLTIKSDISDTTYKNLTDEYGDATSETLYIEFENDDERVTNNVFVYDADDYVQFTDSNRNLITIDDNSGVYITRKMGSLYGYEIGDTIKWHIYGKNKWYTSKIVGFNRDPQNQNITMTRKYLESLDIKYEPDSLYSNKDLSKVDKIKGVSLIQDKTSLREGMENMLNTFITMIIMLIVLGAILGAIIIYNLGILSYTEKQYQFATLKVLGFKDKQIQKIFIKQNLWIAIVAIIIGLPLGYQVINFMFVEAIGDTYDFNADIMWYSYVASAIGTYVVTWLVSKFLSRKIKTIDMVSSLKGNE